MHKKIVFLGTLILCITTASFASDRKKRLSARILRLEDGTVYRTSTTPKNKLANRFSLFQTMDNEDSSCTNEDSSCTKVKELTPEKKKKHKKRRKRRKKKTLKDDIGDTLLRKISKNPCRYVPTIAIPAILIAFGFLANLARD